MWIKAKNSLLANTFPVSFYLYSLIPPWTNTMILNLLVSEHIRLKTPTQSNLGGQLEEWTNVRNTKNQYSKQLRNFLKVSKADR